MKCKEQNQKNWRNQDITFRLMSTKPWNVSINTNASYYVYTHTKAHMKKIGATIKIKVPSQERNQLRIQITLKSKPPPFPKQKEN